MNSFNELKQTETNEHHKRIFDILAQHEKLDMTCDSFGEIVLDTAEIETIRDELYQNVRDAQLADGAIQSVAELKESLTLKTQEKIKEYLAQRTQQEALRQHKGIVKDGYFNPVSGIGTYIDPGMETQAFIPVSITPAEATAYYASGGVPARIIEKKAGCLSLDGVKFECSNLSPEDITRLEEYAAETGFNEAYAQGITESLIFGGAVVYPVLKNDNPLSMLHGKRELLKESPEKNFIKYWVTADRWNCVFVPDTNITAQDYLFAKRLFIPLGGYRVNTSRVAMIRPKKLPFWGAIKQMGWSTSDFEGWIKDYEAYEIMKMSLPIMSQQMSLMYHQYPADGLLIENGTEYAKQFFKQNEEQMRNWSILHPKAINNIGEIKILERSYSGYQQLIQEARLALCASARVPESVLFSEKSSGLATDNEQDITLKQSETIRLLFNNVAPSFSNCIELLVYSCFGVNSEQAKFAKQVKLKANNGVVLSDMDKAQLGGQFTQIAGQLVAMGIPLDKAIETAYKLVPGIDVNEELLQEIAGPGEIDEEMWNMMEIDRGLPDE